MVWLDFMAYQPLLVISCQILFLYIYQIYMIHKHIFLITFLNKSEIFFAYNLTFHFLGDRTLNRTLSGATTLGQSGPRSNGNEGVLHIPQIFEATASPSDGLMS